MIGENEEENIDGLTYEQRIGLYPYEFAEIKREAFDAYKIREYEDWFEDKFAVRAERIEMDADVNQVFDVLHRQQSFTDDNVKRHEIAKEIKAKRNPHKEVTFVKKYFVKNSYFQRLFPLIKEQKPGVDLYAKITFV